jgi:hypothetical protein
MIRAESWDETREPNNEKMTKGVMYRIMSRTHMKTTKTIRKFPHYGQRQISNDMSHVSLRS